MQNLIDASHSEFSELIDSPCLGCGYCNNNPETAVECEDLMKWVLGKSRGK